MKTLCMTSAAWFSHKQRCLHLMEKVLSTLPDAPDSVSIDIHAVLRTSADARPSDSFHYAEFDLRTWIYEGHKEEGILNIEAVRRAAIASAPGKHVLIDATGFAPEVVERGLCEFHAGLYSLPDWPASVNVICDEAQIYQILPRLTTVFYIRPDIMSRTAIDTVLRWKKQEALMLLLYGRGIGGASTIVKMIVAMVLKRREVQIAKQRGWIWED